MKVLYHLPSVHSMYAGRFIAQGYQDAFTDLGHVFRLVGNTENVLRVAEEYSPDLFITSSHRICTDHLDFGQLTRLRSRGLCVAVQIDRLTFPEDAGHALGRRPELLQRIRDDQFGDVYFNYYQTEHMQDFVQVTGRQHHTILLAANRLVHYPQEADPNWASDAIFIGAYLPRKRETFAKLLAPLRARYRVRVYGPDWSVRDRAIGFVQRVSQYLNLRLFDRLRSPSLTQDEERAAYASTRIGINIHETQQRRDGQDFNERTLKIMACGAFQLCDHVAGIRKYFTPSELVMARDDEWEAQFEYYFHHDRERRDIQERGTHKVHEEHTYHHRVAQFLELWERWRIGRAFNTNK